MHKYLISALCTIVFLLSSCKDTDEPGTSADNTEDTTYSAVPDFNSTIEPFDPTVRATDTYTPDDNNDIYWQANKFKATVDIVYDGATASVNSSSNDVAVYVTGAHVAVDVKSDIKTQITISGKSDMGSLKIYSEAKVLLILDNVDLKSDIGPAVNSQSKKRLFVHASDNSVNTLADSQTYSDDKYYKQGSSSAQEDRKGAFFTEDNTIFSGNGLVTIKGYNRHALATDGSLRILPGSTLCVESNVKNAIHAKGSSKEFGVSIEGGYIYALCSGEAGRCIKSDLEVRISNATLSLNNSSSAVYDETENDTSSPAGIKSDTDIRLENSNIYIKNTGDGAKGLNADGDVDIASTKLTVTSTGKRYTHNSDSSSPSGIKSATSVTVSSGEINVAMYGDDSKSDAIVSDGSINVKGGDIYTYAYGNCFNTAATVEITAGNIYALSESKEAIEAASAINVNGGLILTHSPAALVSAEPKLNVGSGAAMVCVGGNTMTNPSSSSTTAVRISNINLPAGVPLSVLSSTGNGLFSMTFLKECKNCPLLIASPEFKQGTSWVMTTGGSMPDSNKGWNGYVQGETAIGGIIFSTFTI